MDFATGLTTQRGYAATMVKDANTFCNIGINSIKKKKFDYKTSYNIMCMSAEKYLVAYLLSKNIQPADHNLSGLVHEIELIDDMPRLMLLRMVEYMESFLDLCSLEILEQKSISDDEMLKLEQSLLYIREFSEAAVLGRTTLS